MITGLFAAFIISRYSNYESRARWAKAIANTANLKLAMGDCLSYSKGNVTACNDLDKLTKSCISITHFSPLQ